MNELMRIHKQLDENKAGQDYFVGDIHGYYEELMQALKGVGFNPARDRLIAVGDLIDRGPQNIEVLRLLREPWFYAVRGNHEDMFLGRFFYRDPFDETAHQQNGGSWADDLWDHPEQEALVELVLALPLDLTVSVSGAQIGVVHASVLGSDWYVQQSSRHYDQACLWDAEKYHELQEGRTPAPVRGIDAVVSGHIATETLIQVANQVFIDTRYRGGRLSVVSAREILIRVRGLSKQYGGINQ